VCSTRFEDLPEQVVEQTKDYILDCIGTTMGSYAVPEGKVIASLGEEFGEGSEATILPTGQASSAAAAAYVNAKLCNFIDNEETLFNHHHIGGTTVFPALHAGERTNATGRDLLTATVLGYEFTYRFCLNYNKMRINPEGSLDFAQSSGLGFNSISAAVAAGKVFGLDVNQMRNSMGIAGYYITIPIIYKFHFTTPFNMMKYQDMGWFAMSGLMAALFARKGYTGDLEILDDYGDNSLWKVFGMLEFDFDRMTRNLGQTWGIMEMGLKAYPCCRWYHTPIYMLRQLMDTNGLEPDDIREVVVGVHPLVASSEAYRRVGNWSATETKDAVSSQFSLQYNLACAAHGVPPGPQWQLPETLNNPRLAAFCDKVKVVVDERCEQKMVAYILSGQELGKVLTQVNYTLILRTRHGEYKDTADYIYGDSNDALHRLDRPTIIDKFRQNCSTVASISTIDSVIDAVYNLDSLDSVRQLSGLFR